MEIGLGTKKGQRKIIYLFEVNLFLRKNLVI